MKKNVIALAVAAAMAAPLAAQAAPTVYGKVRVSIDSIDYNKDHSKGDAIYMTDRVSRLGVKGSEDLGGGMKAIYGLEWGVNAVDKTETAAGDKQSGLSQRNQYVGLSGGFGTILAGTHDTPYKMVGSADVFGDTAADSQKNGGIIGYNGFDNRANNALAYVSPNLSGWTVMAAVIPGEEDGNSADSADNNANGLADAMSLGVKGAIGPVKVGIGYETFSKKMSGTTTAGEDPKDTSAMKLDLKYTMGTLGLGVTVESSNNGADTKQDQGVLASLTYGMGANVLAVQYGTVDVQKDHVTTTKDDVTLTAVGLIHNFSKATNAYIAYAAYDDKSDADTGDYTGVTVGLNTQF